MYGFVKRLNAFLRLLQIYFQEGKRGTELRENISGFKRGEKVKISIKKHMARHTEKRGFRPFSADFVRVAGKLNYFIEKSASY